MTTINQLKRKPRIEKKNKTNVPRLDKCPQKFGVVIKAFETTPKKPNSARRKVVRIKLSNDKKVTGHISGIGHNLQPHSTVLVRGGRCQDLIGVRYKPIRGKFDFAPVLNRVTRLSKYGIKTKLR